MEKHAVNKISDIVNMMYSVQGTSSRGGGEPLILCHLLNHHVARGSSTVLCLTPQIYQLHG